MNANKESGHGLRPHRLQSQLGYQYLRVLVDEASPHVAMVVLDRPAKRNAIHATLWKELGSVFSHLGLLGDNCRAVVLAGNGHAFCGGIDITDDAFSIRRTDTDDVARTGVTFLPKIQEMQACFTAMETCPLPVVAAIHGRCIGAGIDLVCCADMRLCSADAVFSVREVALGLAADVGTLQRLPKITGNDSLIRELCLTARDFSAEEALRIGLVSRICQTTTSVMDDALQLCKVMASHSPVAVQGTKKALVYARDHTVADGLEQIALYNSMALQGDDLVDAWSARASKSSPSFPNIPTHSRL